jgi:hypothetical protein
METPSVLIGSFPFCGKVHLLYLQAVGPSHARRSVLDSESWAECRVLYKRSFVVVVCQPKEDEPLQGG